MPTPTIPKGSDYFAVPIWTGVNTANAITISSLNFQPDFVWEKPRSVGYTHSLSDSVRGANIRLCSNNTDAEVTNFLYGYTSSFNSNGFTASPGSTDNENWNETGQTYVAWCWKANGTAVSNTAGTITSQVSANTTSGFSVVTYTGNGSTGQVDSVGHGLGVDPTFYIIKQRNATNDWYSFSKASGSWQYGLLNSTQAFASTSQYADSSKIYISGTSTNASGGTFVAYCWAPIAGYSQFGSYTGNGSTDGPFVYLGFRPRFVMIKITSSTGDWVIYDTSRNTSNATINRLFPDLSDAESTGAGGDIDILSNGFKVRSNYGNVNSSGGTFIYACFAENPFKYANAR